MSRHRTIDIDTAMSVTTDGAGVVRDRAEWMRPIDERILETMRDEGNLTPRAVDDFGVTSKSHASDRLRALSKANLVERISRGLYRLTDDGHAFLDEELDAGTLPDPRDQ